MFASIKPHGGNTPPTAVQEAGVAWGGAGCKGQAGAGGRLDGAGWLAWHGLGLAWLGWAWHGLAWLVQVAGAGAWR